MKYLLFIIVFIFCMTNFARASELHGSLSEEKTQESSDLHTRCVSVLEALENRSTVLELETKLGDLGEATLREEASKLVMAVKEKISTSRFSHPQHLASEVLANWNQSVFDLVLAISKQKIGLDVSRYKESMARANAALYGTQSIGLLVGKLQNILAEGKPSVFKLSRWLSPDYKLKVLVLAKKISGCRKTIGLCKIKFSAIVQDLNEEYILLQATSSLMVERERILREAMEQTSEKILVESFKRELEKLGIQQLQVSAMTGGLSQILGKVREIKERADAVNESEIVKSVISASSQGLDLDFLVEGDSKLNPSLSLVKISLGDRQILDHMIYLLSSPTSSRIALNILEDYANSTPISIDVLREIVPIIYKFDDSSWRDDQFIQKIVYPATEFLPHNFMNVNSKFPLKIIVITKILSRVTQSDLRKISKEDAHVIAGEILTDSTWSYYGGLEKYVISHLHTLVSE